MSPWDSAFHIRSRLLRSRSFPSHTSRDPASQRAGFAAYADVTDEVSQQQHLVFLGPIALDVQANSAEFAIADAAFMPPPMLSHCATSHAWPGSRPYNSMSQLLLLLASAPVQQLIPLTLKQCCLPHLLLLLILILQADIRGAKHISVVSRSSDVQRHTRAASTNC
jgi:hypothetical protein